VRATERRVSLSIWLYIGLLAAAAVTHAQQIQYAEPVQLDVRGATAGFDAYGRRFSLTLADNERALARLSTQRKRDLGTYRLLRGSLEGQPGSWVRLTESANGVEGAIWDGRDFYAVTRYERIAPLLTNPLDAAPGQTVVYRLSDARDLLPQDFCALGSDAVGASKQTTLDQYQGLVSNLEGAAEAQMTRQMEIALIADSDFAAHFPDDPTAAMLARFNVVEGIFSEQLGLLLLPTDIRVMSTTSDPFTSTDATTLLGQVGKYREATAAVRARGLAHLMTGKNLDGTTAGIAYLNAACGVDRGVSLSSHSYGTAVSALIIAHELGHNFGAPHDGEAGGACAASPGTGHIMAPVVSGYATFSQCSRDVMQTSLALASCVTRADYSDVSLSAGDGSRNVDGGVNFDLPWTVRSGGTSAVDDVTFTVRLPESAGLSLKGISADEGNCSMAGTTAICSFGTLAPGESRSIRLTARALLAGNLVARGEVSGANDQLMSNNTREVALNIRSGVDAAVTLFAAAPEVPLGAPLEIVADVSSLRALAVRDAVLSLNFNQSVASASMSGAECVTRAFSVSCTIAELPGGSTRRLTVMTNTVAAGPLVATASISAAGDGDLSNNSSSAPGWVQSARDIELTAGPSSVELAVGDAYDLPLVVRSRGPEATAPVTLMVALPEGLTVDLVDSAGAPCSQPDSGSLECDLGLLSSGATHVVQLRVRGNHSGAPVLFATADAADDGYAPNDNAAVQFRIDNPIDLGLLLASGGVGIEDRDIDGSVTLRSDGRETAVGATLDIEIASAGELKSAAIHNGAPCELVTPQHARCALPAVLRGAQMDVDYKVFYAEPGSYEVKFSLTTPGDTATANDTLARAILVKPYNDVSISGELDLTRLMVGEVRERTFRIRAGRRALESARFSAKHFLPGVRVAAISASNGACELDADAGASCVFTQLPADSEYEVTVSWRAESAAEADIIVGVTTAGDVAMSNNVVRGRAEVMGHTDLELRVNAGVNGAAGATLDFPPITLANGAEKAFGTRLDVALPEGVTLVSISAAHAICSGTTELRCDFGVLEANSSTTVNLSVRAAQRGSHVTTLKLTSLNDTNPANDSREVALDITASSGATATAKSSGGGGSFEWLTLALLTLALWVRCRAGNSALVPGRHFGISAGPAVRQSPAAFTGR
jgi:hypothetical protein